MKIQVTGRGYKYEINSWFFTGWKLKRYGFHKCVNVPGLASREQDKNTANTLARLKGGHKAVIMIDGKVITLTKVDNSLVKFFKACFC